MRGPHAPSILAVVWRTLCSSGVVELAARCGYAARGMVYLSVGLMALLKSAGLNPHAQGAVGALGAWARWPLGVALLWMTGIGLLGFAAWRGLQSIGDVEHPRWRPSALAGRIGKAISGLQPWDHGPQPSQPSQRSARYPQGP